MTKATLKLLVLQDDVEGVELLLRHLRAAGIPCAHDLASNGGDFHQHLERGVHDLVLAGYGVSDFGAGQALVLRGNLGSHIPLIVVADADGEGAAIDLIHAGAEDYVLQDNLARLPVAVERALHDARLRSRDRFRARAKALRPRVRDQVWRVHTRNDFDDVLHAIREVLVEAGIAFRAGSITIIPDLRSPASTRIHTMTRGGRWEPTELNCADNSTFLRVWRRGGVVYRPDLLEDDAYGEREELAGVYGYPVRCVADAIFGGGSLALNSAQPHAFEEEHLEFLRELADLVEEAWRHLQGLDALRAKDEELQRSRRLEAVGQLAGGIAHDFGNIITVVMGVCDLILRRLPDDDRLRGGLQEIREAAERGAGLVRQLLVFSRRQVLDPAILDLTEIVAGLDKILRRTLGEDVDMDVRTGAKLPRIRADRGQVEQILMNLAINARDAMPEGGRLSVKTAHVHLDAAEVRGHLFIEPGDYVLLSIADTGKGMSKEVLQHIFEPFFTTKGDQGTGMGLATVYGIVKQAGGYITADSEPGVGTTFKIHFPAVHLPVDRQRPRHRPDRLTGSETVLVVEDDAVLLRVMADGLREHGYTVLSASDGAMAQAVCRRHDGALHLLLTDVVLPGAGGLEVAAHVGRSHPESATLFISGFEDRTSIQKTIIEPRRSFLAKPFDLDSLLAKVREVLDRSHEGAAS